MRASDIVGKRVKAIKQQRFDMLHGETTRKVMATHLDWIEFEDGTLLMLSALETDLEPYVQAVVVKPKR